MRTHTHKHIYKYTLHIHDLDRFGPFSRGWFGWKTCTLAVTFYMDMISFFSGEKIAISAAGIRQLIVSQVLDSDHCVFSEMKSSPAGSNFSSTGLCKCFNDTYINSNKQISPCTWYMIIIGWAWSLADPKWYSFEVCELQLCKGWTRIHNDTYLQLITLHT